MTEEDNKQGQTQRRVTPKGLVNPIIVNVCSLIIITICILIAVTASIMAIWEYANTDTLFRTIATVAVIIVGVALFAKSNQTLGE